MNASAGNDSWGWTDPQDGKEYALIGLNNGTAFIDISNPTNPVYLGKLPTHTVNSSWRDIKVYDNYAFVVSEANNHGMQVFDLTRLRNVANPPQTFTEDEHYDQFGNAHNIVINEESGFAYGVGTGTFNGGPHFVNIQDPLNPIAAGGYGEDNYSHDAQVITYCGPDQDYIGREILIGSNENEIAIVDITDKNNPTGISTISYANLGFTHQGWFTEDQRYFILGDEIDEINFGFNTRSIIFDFNDLDNPSFAFDYSGPTFAIDHNGYVKGNKYYLANYRAGIRVIDITNIGDGNMEEEGFFDSFPNNDNTNFDGAWNVYPYFDSGNIVISDINRGFLLVKASNGDTTPPNAVCANITLELDSSGNATISPDDLNGGSTDNIDVTGFIVCERFFACDDIGENLVEFEVFDAFGNRDSCMATVTVIDVRKPAMTCPDNMEVQFDAGEAFYTLPDFVADGLVSATDNCTSNLTISQNIAPGTQLETGNFFIEFESVDDSGNIGTCMFQIAVETVLSVDASQISEGLTIFPNPADAEITISSDFAEINSITIVDITGRTVLNENSLSDRSRLLDISGYKNGVYFVTINNVVTKKIIKR